MAILSPHIFPHSLEFSSSFINCLFLLIPHSQQIFSAIPHTQPSTGPFCIFPHLHINIFRPIMIHHHHQSNGHHHHHHRHHHHPLASVAPVLRNANLLITFLLCPFIGTSSFLLPPPQQLEMIIPKNIVAPNEKVHLLDGKLLLKLSSSDPNMQSSSALMTSSADDGEEEEEQVCAKSAHQNATILHSISKSTDEVVHLHPHSNFNVVFCTNANVGQQGKMEAEAGAETEECAIGASCASVYRWARALVRHAHPRMPGAAAASAGYVQDLVLVPIDCLCVLGWAENYGLNKEPIILE